MSTVSAREPELQGSRAALPSSSNKEHYLSPTHLPTPEVRGLRIHHKGPPAYHQQKRRETEAQGRGRSQPKVTQGCTAAPDLEPRAPDSLSSALHTLETAGCSLNPWGTVEKTAMGLWLRKDQVVSMLPRDEAGAIKPASVVLEVWSEDGTSSPSVGLEGAQWGSTFCHPPLPHTVYRGRRSPDPHDTPWLRRPGKQVVSGDPRRVL